MVPGLPVLLRVGVWEPTELRLEGSTTRGGESSLEAVANAAEAAREIAGSSLLSICQLSGLGSSGAAAALGGRYALGNDCTLRGWMVRSSAFQPRLRLWRLHTAMAGASNRHPIDQSSDNVHRTFTAGEEPPSSVDDGATCQCPESAIGPGVSTGAAKSLLSMLPSKQPQKHSPLANALANGDARAPQLVSKVVGRAGDSGRTKSGGMLRHDTDQPVTFNKKIASSGYGRPPVMKLHAGGPSTRASAASRAAATTTSRAERGGPLPRRYTPARGPMCFLQSRESDALPAMGSALLRLTFAPDASRLAMAAADGSVSIARLPARRHAHQLVSTMLGHRAALHSASWSLTGRLLLTAGADGVGCLWDVGHESPPPMPLLRFEYAEHSPRPGAAPSAADRRANPPYGAEVRHAQFFYLDRFVLLSAGSTAHLYSYSLQRRPAHDAERAAELRHHYKLEHKWSMPRAQSITCMAAANTFLSSIVLTTGSNRSIVAVDLGTGQQVLPNVRYVSLPTHATTFSRICASYVPPMNTILSGFE